MKLPRYALTGSSVINVLGAVVVASLLWSLGQTIHRNYLLGQQINQLRYDTQVLKDKKEELSYQIQYFRTDSYREREARSKLGLQLPGENVVIIPRTTEPTPAPSQTKDDTAKKSNLQLWFDFLSGKNRG